MTLKRILTTGVSLVLLSLTVAAQDALQPSVSISTDPSGALVTLTGEVVVVGVTPASFHHSLFGDYRVEVERPGYEKYSTRVFLDPSKSSVLNIHLSPKTRFKSFARSLFLPGWGQRYSDQKGKGLFFTTAAFGSLAFYLVANKSFNDENDIFENKLAEYDEAYRNGTYEELTRLKRELDIAQDDAYDAENWRRAAIGTVIGVWGVNLLDALLFFPDRRGLLPSVGITLSPGTESGPVGLTISKAF